VVSAVNSGIESGNSGQASVLSLPDLIVTSLTWTPASPLTGNHVVFTAIVTNQGTASTPTGVEIGVGFYIDGSDVSWSGNDTTSLAPGKSVTLTANSGPTGVNYWVATHGSHTAKAWVDDAGRITESNEGNNTLSKSITVN
jgi:subtilase family serine protease